MSKSKEEMLWQACTDGDLEVVKKLVDDPAVDVNWRDPDVGRTPFYRACFFGWTSVVEFLMRNPRIDPTEPQNEGATPFNIACQKAHQEVVSLLLADPRIDPNKPTNNQTTPLWQASQNGHLAVVQHLLASGREIDTKMKSTFNNRTAARQGRASGTATRGADESAEAYERGKTFGPLCADLIDEYEREPEHLRVFHRLRRQPGVREYFIGHLFALVIFHLDSFVVINERTAHSDTRRFFKIASRLPLEIQMVLCNRTFGSPRDIILSRYSEPGFQLLTRTTTWQR